LPICLAFLVDDFTSFVEHRRIALAPCVSARAAQGSVVRETQQVLVRFWREFSSAREMDRLLFTDRFRLAPKFR
jgi:hypothetical protein